MENIDIKLLREQRDWLLHQPDVEECRGLVSLMDDMIDQLHLKGSAIYAETSACSSD